MKNLSASRMSLAVLLVAAAALPLPADDADRLVAALLGATPIEDDLRALTDEIGGRATGSPANLRAVEWALARFQAAGVPARREPFTMPALWLGRSARAEVRGDASFISRVEAMPYSMAASDAMAPLVDGGGGAEKDFERLGTGASGAFVLVETPELVDLDGLFREYAEGAAIERRAVAAGVAGVVYMASRPRALLYRHNASLGPKNRLPMLVMVREDAARALRLLRAGKRLDLRVTVDVEAGPAYESANVVGEIRGRERPDEVVLIGAHLDSWDLGTGALDNGCNVALVLDVARQIQALGLKPRRTIRFALWNGEEQGLFGSWGYVKTHRDELDRHVMAASFDIGSGRITGFFTNGRAELLPVVEHALLPVSGLGPFVQVNEPVVGTDNYDFMLEGVANLVANQESANYGPNYHAASDTFDKVDLRQVRLNAAIAGAVTWAFAQSEVTWRRQTRAEVEALVEGTSLKQQMVNFNLWESWRDGSRGRR
jgi:hypothetical protein